MNKRVYEPLREFAKMRLLAPPGCRGLMASYGRVAKVGVFWS